MSKPFAVYDVYGKAITSSDYRAGSHGKFYSVVTDNSNVDYIFFSTSTVGNFIVLYFVKPPALAY